MSSLLDIVQEAALPAAIFAVMVTIGMELTRADFRRMVAYPRIAIVGVLAQALVFPAVALVLLASVNLSPATAVGLAILAACPSGGFSNVLTLLGRGDLALSITLTTASSLLAIISLPLLMAAGMAIVDGREATVGFVQVPLGPTLGQMFGVVLLPVVLGMVLRARWPEFVAARIEQAQRITQYLLYGIVALLAFNDWATFEANVGSALPVAVVMALSSLAVGYLLPRLFGLSEREAFTIGIETATRNVGLSTLIAVAVLNHLEWAIFGATYMLPASAIGFFAAVLHRRYYARMRRDRGHA